MSPLKVGPDPYGKLVAFVFVTSVAASDDTTNLQRAISTNEPVMKIESLIQAGADVNAANRYGVTPLSLAAANGNDRVLELLLKSGANRKAADAALLDGRTLLMLAARTGNAAAIRWALDTGLTVQRHLLRMRRGTKLAERIDELWASSGPEMG